MSKAPRDVAERIRRAIGRGQRALTPGYAEEQRRATLTQIRWVTLMAVAPMVAALALSLLTFSDHLPERLASFMIAAVVCLGTRGLCRLEWAKRRAIPIAVLFVAANLATGLWWASFLPFGLDVLVGAAAAVAVMTVTALVLPWGAAPQLGVSLLAALGFFCLVSRSSFDVSLSVNMLIALGLGVLPSTFSALLLDWRRQVIFAERTRAKALALQQGVLAKLSQKALAGTDVAPLLDEAVELIARVFDVEYVCVLELLPGNRSLLLRAGVGWSKGMVGEARVSADGDSQAGYALSSGAPLIVEDLRTETRFGVPPLLSDHGVVSGISVVIPDPDHPFGLLGVHTAQVRTFTDDEAGFLQSAAIVIAAAVGRTRAKQALTTAKERLERLLASSLTIVYSAEASGDFQLTFLSENVATALGYTAQELLEARRPVHLVHSEDLPCLIAASRRLAEEGTATVECRIRHKDGTYRSMYNQLRLLRDVRGKPVEVVGSSTDLSDRKHVEEQLRQARDAAEAAGRVKNEFLDNMSHEIRTPMNAIFGMTDILLDTTLSSEQREYAETVRRSAQTLLSIMEDILDFSKLETGRLELQRRSFRLRDHFDDTLRWLIPPAAKKGIELVVDVLPDIPDGLLGDPQRLRQLLVNLIGNAIKFTEQGKVTVRVSVESQAEDAIVLQFSVKDTGIGIQTEKRREIFEAFVQADGSMTRQYGGTGLGLTISAQLVEMMGGRIWFESEVGQGSTFLFTARFGLQQEASETDVPCSVIGVSSAPLRILVAEDDAVNRMVVVSILEKRGHTVVTAEDGEQALAILEAQPVDIVVMDVQMPQMDGLEATKAIRALEQDTGGHVPIVALTAHARRRDRDRCLEVGMDAYVSKPIQAADLFAAIERVGLQLAGEGTGASETFEANEPEGPCELAESGSLCVLHRESLRMRVGDDAALLLDLVKLFQENSRKTLEEIRNGLSTRDSGVVERAAHQLKGSLSTMSAMAAQDVALQLEELGRSGDLAPADEALSVLESELARLDPELTALASEVVGSSDS